MRPNMRTMIAENIFKYLVLQKRWVNITTYGVVSKIYEHSPCSADSKNIKISSKLIWEVPALEWSFMDQKASKYKGYGQIY